MFFNELTNEQRRQLTDARQVFQAYCDTQNEYERRFVGSMRWGERKGKRYLLRKVGSSETSLGPCSSKTEEAFEAFENGRKEFKDRLKSLTNRLDQMAPVNTALGIGRVPKLTARIIRRLDGAGVLGRNIIIVGSNALFAYEMSAGILLGADVVATGDVDFLLDNRRGIRFAVQDFKKDGVLGLLKKVDKSFSVRHPKDFRAINEKGFFVDLICPEDKNFRQEQIQEKLGESSDNLYGAPIGGLEWLVNAPKIEQVVIAEDGYPLRMCCVDPRVYALHKAWVAGRDDRDPLKRTRDRAQAKIAALIATQYLGLDIEGDDLSALPDQLRSRAKDLVAIENNEHDDRLTPNW
jgi:hypothetical protein